jgi:hypothetical protein
MPRDAGLFVFFGQPALFSFFLVLIPLQYVRIRAERSALEAKFGDAANIASAPGSEKKAQQLAEEDHVSECRSPCGPNKLPRD